MSVELSEIALNGDIYYNATQLKELEPAFFFKCSRCIKKVVEVKNIPGEGYIFASANKTGYKVYEENPPKTAALYIKKSWAEENILKNVRKSDDSVSTSDVDYTVAPPLIFLEDECKFRDEEGNILEIETRGVRTPTGIYFLVKDVSELFGITELCKVLINNASSYVYNEDYICFISKDVYGKLHKILYLTYEGLLRVIMTTRSNKTRPFMKWITRVLFTVQMGEQEAKEELASEILSVNVKSMREALSRSSTSVPCVYLFSLGLCKDLRLSMSIDDTIPDNYIVVKYGFTNDLNRRTTEHASKFGKLDGVNMELIQYTYIDPIFLSEAEKDICGYFKDIEIPITTYETQKELVAINPSHMKQVLKQYKALNMLYAGHTKEMAAEIDKLKTTIERQEEKLKTTIERQQEREKYEREILMCNYERQLSSEKHDKELLIQKHRNELSEERHRADMYAMEIKNLKAILRKDISIDDIESSLSNIKL